MEVYTEELNLENVCCVNFELEVVVIDYNEAVIDYIGVIVKHPVVIDYCNRLPIICTPCNRLCGACNGF